jgi:hypothetical protein
MSSCNPWWRDHVWGRWEDVEVVEDRTAKAGRFTYCIALFPVHVIKQQRRCSRCNIVETRIG